MRKIALVLALLVPLAGCAQLQNAVDIVGKITQPITNPVTREMLHNVENGGIMIFAGLKAYKRACVERSIPQTCRTTIQKMHPHTRQLKPLLRDLRSFVDNNQQINAMSAYNHITQIINDVRAIARAGGAL